MKIEPRRFEPREQHIEINRALKRTDCGLIRRASDACAFRYE
ncbi:MAG TPA: hypothetical protein VGC76_13360 [Pyrinomonadaceae bacterium]|jgi:hypothetical protein